VSVENLKIKVRRVRDNRSYLPLPSFQTTGASGCDLVADLQQAVTLQPKERKLIPTGIAVEIPPGFEAQIRPRSGLAIKKGITVANAPGTIDADYRGEIQVILINLGEQAVSFNCGDRIAQMIIQRVCRVEWEEVNVLTKTTRAEGGFGHTGSRSRHPESPFSRGQAPRGGTE